MFCLKNLFIKKINSTFEKNAEAEKHFQKE